MPSKIKKPERNVWSMMKRRCLKPGSKAYERYGGRGITVCDRWKQYGGFANFLKDMGPRPSKRHSLDRIDNDKGYSPENCRWATPEEQSRNRSCTRYIEYEGRRQCLTAWAQELGLPPGTIRRRIRLGWPSEQLLVPKGHKRRSYKRPGRWPGKKRARTLALLATMKEPVSTEYLAQLDGSSVVAMCSRLQGMKHMGLARAERHGRKRLWLAPISA